MHNILLISIVALSLNSSVFAAPVSQIGFCPSEGRVRTALQAALDKLPSPSSQEYKTIAEHALKTLALSGKAKGKIEEIKIKIPALQVSESTSGKKVGCHYANVNNPKEIIFQLEINTQ
jgi:hypothetical protein